MPVLSPCEDIKSLIERFAGVQIVGKPSRVRGVLEYHSNCPCCPGSTDSFIIRPETGWYTHSARAKGCGRHGDMLDFLQDYVGMSMREAIEEIGLDPDELDFILDERAEERALARIAPPCKEWQDSARTWIHLFRTRRTLVKHPFALEYVHARGLSDESIEKFDIQYIPLDASGSWLVDKEPEKWGLSPAECPEVNTEEGIKHVVKLPEGILIPWYAEGHLWKLEVRRLTDVKSHAKYMCIQGGQDTILFNLDAIAPGKPVVLVESAFCAILGEQIAGDLAVFVATGGAKKAQVERFVKLLSQAFCVLVGFDDDKPDSEGKRAGDDGAKYWTEHLSNAIRWRPSAHDINDMLREGKDIRKWVTRGLQTYELVAKAKSLPVPAAAPAPVQPRMVEQVQAFYDAFCSQPGYSLRLREDGRIGIGVPEAVSDEEYERIEQEVCAQGEALLLVLSGQASVAAPATVDEGLPGIPVYEMPQAEYLAMIQQQAIEQHRQELRAQLKPYSPATLPPLPRKRCPHSVLTDNHKIHPCKGMPGANGWCEEHAASHDLLCLGATLGYPAVELNPYRSIAAGVANWEAYAERAPKKWLSVDMRVIRVKFNYHEDLKAIQADVQTIDEPSEELQQIIGW